VLVVVAAVVWWWATAALVRRPGRRLQRPPSRSTRAPLVAPPGRVGLTIAVLGQAFAYYGMTAWLPVLCRPARDDPGSRRA
jgi:CP family cyanate transporter-like MFS transporter